MNGEYTVSPAGMIALPLVGQIAADGRTSQALAGEIAAALQKKTGLISPPATTVEVVRYPSVFVTGSVERPGEFEFKPGSASCRRSPWPAGVCAGPIRRAVIPSSNRSAMRARSAVLISSFCSLRPGGRGSKRSLSRARVSISTPLFRDDLWPGTQPSSCGTRRPYSKLAATPISASAVRSMNSAHCSARKSGFSAKRWWHRTVRSKSPRKSSAMSRSWSKRARSQNRARQGSSALLPTSSRVVSILRLPPCAPGSG
ncbi:polysaccharide export protein [Nitratireductor aquibiodomus RA22]|uniref:Polysaccharide export protein n=1 Tax=Nitratireductor aquibiodomus RA22 TaxID=1189611 RepID=I5C2Q2_9HYPH|nr:polysaccharide export protein [Nitratireductor aquibiodomus RA22]